MSKQAIITLETAKDMYKSNIQSLVKLALDNFSKEELESIDFPKSWEDLKEVKGYYINRSSEIDFVSNGIITKWNRNLFPKESTARAVLALAQLLQLREVFVKDWVNDWNDDNIKYVIKTSGNTVNRYSIYKDNSMLSFPTKELRDKFFDMYKDLLEEAKELL